jgi:hypothetical protein
MTVTYRTVLVAACGLALVFAMSACQMDKPQTAAGPNYQAPLAKSAPPANLHSVCFVDPDLAAFRARMVQQELVVGVLSCPGADGSRKLDKQYAAFIAKFTPELATNAQDLKSIVARKGRNFDVVITEIANRTAQQPTGDAAFCSRHERALEWSLSPSVTSLTQVPSPYDFGPEMNVFPCPAK